MLTGPGVVQTCSPSSLPPTPPPPPRPSHPTPWAQAGAGRGKESSAAHNAGFSCAGPSPALRTMDFRLVKAFFTPDADFLEFGDFAAPQWG